MTTKKPRDLVPGDRVVIEGRPHRVASPEPERVRVNFVDDEGMNRTLLMDAETDVEMERGPE